MVSSSETAKPVVENYSTVFLETYDAADAWEKAFDDIQRALNNRDMSELELGMPSPTNDIRTIPNTGYRKIAGWLEKTKIEERKVKDRYTNNV